MITFISCAKTMAMESRAGVPSFAEPQYIRHAEEIAEKLAAMSAEDLMDTLKVSPRIAEENRARYAGIVHGEAELMPALSAYTGIVFKHIHPEDFSTEDWEYANRHLRITSFLYGLVKPLDMISPYRLEGNVTLWNGASGSVFRYWQPVLTDNFIREIKADGGILMNLASGEMKKLFNWKKVESEVKVILPEFLMRGNDGKAKTVTIYAKMCRGEMTRHIILDRIDNPEELKDFRHDGFTFCPELSSDTKYVFIKEM